MTANSIQRDLMNDGIKQIESKIGELSKQDKTLFCLNWIKENAKSFRKFYNETILIVSYKPTFDSDDVEKRMTISDFEDFEIKPDYRELAIVREV